MIMYCVYRRIGENPPNPFNGAEPIFSNENFTKARDFILEKCKNENVVMTEERIQDWGENNQTVIEFSFVPALCYTIC